MRTPDVQPTITRLAAAMIDSTNTRKVKQSTFLHYECQQGMQEEKPYDTSNS
jgi:hypothetical protein